MWRGQDGDGVGRRWIEAGKETVFVAVAPSMSCPPSCLHPPSQVHLDLSSKVAKVNPRRPMQTAEADSEEVSRARNSPTRCSMCSIGTLASVHRKIVLACPVLQRNASIC